MGCVPLALVAQADESGDIFVYVTVAIVAASSWWAAICSGLARYFNDTRLERTLLWLQIVSIAIHPAAWGLLFIGVLRPDDRYIGPLAIPCVAIIIFVIVGTRRLRSVFAALMGNVLALIADVAVFMGIMFGMSKW